MADRNHWTGKSFTGADWEVYQGDSLQVLKKLPPEQFNCVVTSPPYYWLRDYGMPGQIGHEENVSLCGSDR
jgi:DNA modification methylase